jgi:hypothetical protein
MRFRQQIQTSATKLLGKSGQGYGTVAAHPDIPRAVREYTDNLGITQIEGEAKASYCFAREEGWILLNRTIVALPDQTGRSNHVAHTLAAPESEVQTWLDAQRANGEALWSPATLMLQFEVAETWKETWKEDARDLGEADLIAVPTIMEGGAWLPSVWKGHPEKALAALTTDSQIKTLKWNWEGIDEAIEQLRCYAHASSVMDPDQGKRRPQPEIDRLFPENLRCSWEWTFATVLLDSQKPDDFKWFGISKARNKGNTSPREEFFPSHAAVATDDPRADYIRNKEEAISRMNQESYNAAVNKLKGLLEEWRLSFGKKYRENEIPNAPDCLSEIEWFIQICRDKRANISKAQQELASLQKSLSNAQGMQTKHQDEAKEWSDSAEKALNAVAKIFRPASLDETLLEFKCANEKWGDDRFPELSAEYERLKSVSQSLEYKIKELRNETSHLKQLLNPVQSIQPGMPRAATAVLPKPSTVVSRQPHYLVPGTQDTLKKPTELRVQTTEDRNLGSKPNKTKRKTNAIWMWILGMIFMGLNGFIGYKLYEFGFKEGKVKGEEELKSVRASRYSEGVVAGRAEVDAETKKASSVTKIQGRRAKDGSALNEPKTSSPQQEGGPKSSEMHGAKDAPPNTNSQPKTPVKSTEPTDSRSVPNESQDGKDETKEKGDGKSIEPAKDSGAVNSEPKSVDPKTK